MQNGNIRAPTQPFTLGACAQRGALAIVQAFFATLPNEKIIPVSLLHNMPIAEVLIVWTYMKWFVFMNTMIDKI